MSGVASGRSVLLRLDGTDIGHEWRPGHGWGRGIDSELAPVRGKDIASGMIDARSGAVDSRCRRRASGVSTVPGVTRGLNAATLRTENNGRDAETTWLMVKAYGEGKSEREYTCVLKRERVRKRGK